MRQVARAGDGGAIWLLVLLGMARKNPVASWRAAGVLAIGALIVNGPVKRVVRRERPEILEGVPSQPGGSSFPSGHAFTSWLTVGMLPAAGPVKAVIRIGAGIISGSRVYLRYHHLSDVLVGSLAGWAVGRLTRRFLRW